MTDPSRAVDTPTPPDPKPDGWHTYHICGGLIRELTWSEGQALCVVCGQWFNARAALATPDPSIPERPDREGALPHTHDTIRHTHGGARHDHHMDPRFGSIPERPAEPPRIDWHQVADEIEMAGHKALTAATSPKDVRWFHEEVARIRAAMVEDALAERASRLGSSPDLTGLDVERLAEVLHARRPGHFLGGACDDCRRDARAIATEYARPSAPPTPETPTP